MRGLPYEYARRIRQLDATVDTTAFSLLGGTLNRRKNEQDRMGSHSQTRAGDWSLRGSGWTGCTRNSGRSYHVVSDAEKALIQSSQWGVWPGLVEPVPVDGYRAGRCVNWRCRWRVSASCPGTVRPST